MNWLMNTLLHGLSWGLVWLGVLILVGLGRQARKRRGARQPAIRADDRHANTASRQE